MACTLTDTELSLIVKGFTRRERPAKADLWLSRGWHRPGVKERLARYWKAKIAQDAALAARACQTWEDYQAVVAGVLTTPVPSGQKTALGVGPGTELKKLLKKFGIVATPNCSCNARANLMDASGPDWCEANRETILDWLAEEAAKRKLPFSRPAAGLMLTFAIRRGRKALSHLKTP